MKVNRLLALGVAAIVGVASLSGCLGRNEESASSDEGGSSLPLAAPTVPAGTSLAVRLTSNISSETARVGDAWSGVVEGPVTVGSEVVVADGSRVGGVVSGVQEAKRGSRALLELAVESVETERGSRNVHAVTEPVIAGSPRARNLGAIAGGAAAGALIGKAIGGDGKDAAVGGLIGGAAATGLVARSKGYQVVLKPGTVMTFTVASRS